MEERTLRVDRVGDTDRAVGRRREGRILEEPLQGVTRVDKRDASVTVDVAGGRPRSRDESKEPQRGDEDRDVNRRPVESRRDDALMAFPEVRVAFGRVRLFTAFPW